MALFLTKGSWALRTIGIASGKGGVGKTTNGKASKFKGINGSFRQGDWVGFKLSINPTKQTLELETLFNDMPEYFFTETQFAVDDSRSDPQDTINTQSKNPLSVFARGSQGQLILHRYSEDDWQGLIITREFNSVSETGLIATFNCFGVGPDIKRIYNDL